MCSVRCTVLSILISLKIVKIKLNFITLLYDCKEGTLALLELAPCYFENLHDTLYHLHLSEQDASLNKNK